MWAPNLDNVQVGDGRAGDARCLGSVWLPDRRATDRWDNGGAWESWYAVSGGATYTFGIWVHGDKADSYREFKPLLGEVRSVPNQARPDVLDQARPLCTSANIG